MEPMRKFFLGLAFAGAMWAQQVDFAKQEIETVKITDSIYILMGGPAQGNVLVSVGADGIFLVDSMYAQMHDKLLAAIRKLSSAPIRYVVNTHLHGDHTAGNAAFQKLGAVVLSQDNMRQRMVDGKMDGVPNMTYGSTLTLHFNGDEISMFHPAPAHTDGDTIIYFKKANVMHVGDVPASLRYPNIGVNEGGTVDGMMAAGNQVMQVANAQTKIIPGHLGPVIGCGEIRQQLEMFTAIRARVATAIREGKTLEQVVAAKITKDFDPGRLGGAITPDRFVTLVYTDLSRRR
jgi:glyoxylase-like metal-dependent hydrolase (beta-lactamase superfamily II)